MKKQILSILAAFVLVLSTPLLAQSTDEPVNEPVVQEQEQPIETPQQEEVTMEEEALEDVEATEEEQELPQTASPLALLLVLGAGAGVSAFGIRRARRR